MFTNIWSFTIQSAINDSSWRFSTRCSLLILNLLSINSWPWDNVQTFGELLIVFSTKVNLLYLLYSTDQRCCLLYLIKQNYLLKTFQQTQILMTLVSLYSQDGWKGHNKPWFLKSVRSWLYSSGGSKELWAWTFIHTS